MIGRRRVSAGLALAIVMTAPTVALPQPAPAPAALVLKLPRPTGASALGTAQFHLIDPARQDTLAPGQARELMISIWYPARAGMNGPIANYMKKSEGEVLAKALLAPIGVNPARVDFSAIKTHAFVDAAADVSRGSHPVILYSPGGNLPRSLGTALVEDLASRGYVVVTIDHTYQSPAVEFPGGRVVLSNLPKGDDVLQQMQAARVADARFVLDQLQALSRGKFADADGKAPPKHLSRALDLSRIGMMGHSAGGFAALETMRQDRRIDAAANLDGSTTYSVSRGLYGEVAERGLDRPFMLIGGGVSGPEKRPHTHQWAPDWKKLWEHSTGWKKDVYIATAEHLAFADHIALLPQLARELKLPPQAVAGALGTGDPARVLAAEQAYLAALFDQHLKKKNQPLLKSAPAQDTFVTFIE